MPKEMIAVFKRVVEAAEAAETGAKPKKLNPLKKLGNSDKADKMGMCPYIYIYTHIYYPLE